MKRILVSLFAVLFALSYSACKAPANNETQPEDAIVGDTVPADGTSAAEPAVFERCEIVSMPDRTEFAPGESPDLTGLVINVILSDGSVLENVDWTCPDATIVNRMESIPVECYGKTIRIPIKVMYAGNADIYSLEHTATVENSPVKGNVYYWLGSSVTYGALTDGISMSDFFAKKWDCVSIKEAVSGTTLNASNTGSYVSRFDRYLESPDRAEHLDGFICQLSTNDTRNKGAFGLVMPDFVTGAEAFDVNTTFGAMEYICAKVRETWNCPIYFYTNTPFNDAAYEDMVQALELMASKWDITIIDMYRDTAFNDISAEERSLYMGDNIHPTMAGYRDWWLVKFESALLPSQ